MDLTPLVLMQCFYLLFNSVPWIAAESNGEPYGNCEEGCSNLWTAIDDLDQSHRQLMETISRCKTSQPTDQQCSTTWTKIYEHGPNGEHLFGDRKDLLHAVDTGASVKIVANNYSYVTNVEHVVPINGHMSAHAVFHISVSNRKFQDSVYWWFVDASTTGQWYMSRYNVGEHTARGDSETKYDMAWFVRRLYEPRPAASYQKGGSLQYGSTRNIISSIRNGYDLRIVSENGYSFSPDNVEIGGQEVAAQSLWHVSQQSDGNRNIMQKNAYWWFTILSSSGVREMSRWTIGQHQSRGANSDQAPTEWYVDPCWRLAYRHDRDGKKIEGNLHVLVSAIERGHRVRLVINDFAFEANVVRFFEDFVEAISMDAVTKSKFNKFETDVSWHIRSASTTGKFREFRTLVGATTTTSASSSVQIAWFVDTRVWEEVLHVAETGKIVFGSRLDLLEHAKKGADVRYVLPSLDKSGGRIVLEADNIQFYEDDLDAMHVRHPNLSEYPSISLIFSLTNLKGNVHVSEWWFGIHSKKAQYDRKVDTRWFVSK